MLKIQIMDMLLPWLLKTGGKLLITVLIAVIGYKVIRAIRKGVGRSMEKAGLEVTLRKFLDALLYAVLIGLLVFMVAEELGIKSSSLVTIAGAVTLEPFPSEYHGKLCRRRSGALFKALQGRRLYRH